MAILKQQSVKLPLLLALPVLLGIGVAAVLLLQDDPPPQPLPPAPILGNDEPRPMADGGDPLTTDPDPRPRPLPKPDAPDSVAVAKAMEGEVAAVTENIRARLELKFKHADYTLDRTWTLAQVVRRPEALAGTHFNATDYTLSFPEGAEPVAVISCATIQGRELPDGPLTLTVDLRTGKSTREGRILARNADGYVLLGEIEYRFISEVLSRAVQAHVLAQGATASGLASLEIAFDVPPEAAFEQADFTAAPVTGAAQSAEFKCRSMRGQQLAQTPTITVNYAKRSVAVSAVSAEGWMELPQDREQFLRRTRWVLREVADRALEHVANGESTSTLSAELASPESWLWSYAVILPLDVKLVFEQDRPQRVTLEVSTCFGRALPFAPVRYVADSSTGTSAFESE